ncbi:ABC transporter [Tissierellia bacterium S5-A11]|nr:ABC transporter [Tissierellia bacterium S5-A11]
MRKSKIFLFLTLILLFGFSQEALAYTQEIFKATPYYIHPVTGVIEDPGNNPGIGQGMTENVVHPQALVETTDDGRIFLSVRYNLANYIKNETFAVQKRGDASFYSVPAQVTASTETTKDYRIEIPSKDVIVRGSFFVGPMGRDVIFYYDIANPTPGNTDFKTLSGGSTSSSSRAPIQNQNQASQAQILNQTSTAISENTAGPTNLPSAGQIIPAAQPGKKVEQKVVNSKFSAGDLGYKHGLLTKDDPQIKKLYYSNQKDKKKGVKKKAPLGPITKAFIYAGIGLLTLLAFSGILVTVGLYIYYKSLERKTYSRMEGLYEKD